MFNLPELSYSTNALEPYIDTQTMEIHHGKHHAAYVKNLNDVLPDKTETDLEQILRTTDNPKVRNNGGGHFNHSLFWTLVCPADKSGQPEGKLLELIASTFGDLPTFKTKFAGVALGRFGSGWAWLTTKGGQLTLEDTPNQDLPQGSPILGLDVWEHAYYLKYQNRRADYIENWWNLVNWRAVSERLLPGLGV